MPDTQLVAFILLLVAAVIAAYFYLKRSQHRDHPPTTPVQYPDAESQNTDTDPSDRP